MSGGASADGAAACLDAESGEPRAERPCRAFASRRVQPARSLPRPSGTGAPSLAELERQQP